MKTTRPPFEDSFHSHITPAITPDPAACCPRCRTAKSSGFRLCIPCDKQETLGAHIDATGFAVYALSTGQTARNMRAYKNPRVRASVRTIAAHMVNTLLCDTLVSHWDCLARTVGIPVDTVTLVPSLSTTRRLGADHALAPMVRMVSERVGIARVNLAAYATHNGDRRALQPEAFTIADGTVEDRHILVVDDTWASGAHISSVALMLRTKGAAHVSAFTVARWVNAQFPATHALAAHIESLEGRFYEQWCPWTLNGRCPP